MLANTQQGRRMPAALSHLRVLHKAIGASPQFATRAA